jgi:thioredoxin-related protein
MRVFFTFAIFITIATLHKGLAQHKVHWNNWDLVNEKIDKGNKKFLVYFYFDGCKWCRYMEESTLRNDQVAKFINNNYYTYKINALSSDKIVIGDRAFTSVRIGKYDFHELAAELLQGKMSFPATAFMDENFRKITVVEGYSDLTTFEMMLSYYTGNHYKKVLWKSFVNNYCKEQYFNNYANNRY